MAKKKARKRVDARYERERIEPLLVPVGDAARMLGVSPRTVASLLAKRKIPHVRIGKRVLFNVAALRDWAARKTRGGFR